MLRWWKRGKSRIYCPISKFRNSPLFHHFLSPYIWPSATALGICVLVHVDWCYSGDGGVTKGLVRGRCFSTAPIYMDLRRLLRQRVALSAVVFALSHPATVAWHDDHNPSPIPTPVPTLIDPGKIEKIWFTAADVDRVDVRSNGILLYVNICACCSASYCAATPFSPRVKSSQVITPQISWKQNPQI